MDSKSANFSRFLFFFWHATQSTIWLFFYIPFPFGLLRFLLLRVFLSFDFWAPHSDIGKFFWNPYFKTQNVPRKENFRVWQGATFNFCESWRTISLPFFFLLLIHIPHRSRSEQKPIFRKFCASTERCDYGRKKFLEGKLKVACTERNVFYGSVIIFCGSFFLF